jgi:NADH:ubiquinone oxidoreductase subunit 4 (subunit M)
VERNRSLPDATRRERVILFTVAAVILWMGLVSPFFTRRMETSSQNVLNQMERVQAAGSAGSNLRGLKLPEKTETHIVGPEGPTP